MIALIVSSSVTGIGAWTLAALFIVAAGCGVLAKLNATALRLVAGVVIAGAIWRSFVIVWDCHGLWDWICWL